MVSGGPVSRNARANADAMIAARRGRTMGRSPASWLHFGCSRALKASEPGYSEPGSVSKKLEATTGFEPVMGVLQTPALPLGYVALLSPPGRHKKHPPGGPGGRIRSFVGAEEET